MARREEPALAIWYGQTHTMTTQTFQNLQNRLPSSGTTQTPGPMEHSPGVPYQSDYGLH
jgi:hypothetical protein